MKTKVHFIILLLVSFCIAEAKTDYSACRGVWSSDNAEAVITDSICIFYCQKDSLMTAYLEIPSAGISSKTTFAKNGTVTTTSDNKPLDFNVLNNNLEILGYSLSKVENIKTVKPYELPQCNSKFDIGRCLQLWRLGGGYGVADDIVYCEINTNRHMFVYMVSPSMTYIRAAAARNCNLGTLFFQNIRMMKNQNTREYTASIQTDNLKVTQYDLEIDNSKFKPGKCTFAPDGGIYWSVISSEPDLILLNGCGETYQVKRHGIESDMEYFEYVPYSPDDKLLNLNGI